MAQRSESKESLDDFPTPCWATRALLFYILNDQRRLRSDTVLEPACNRGAMVRVFRDAFSKVHYADIKDYGIGAPVEDFLLSAHGTHSYDWVITNPPFKLAEQFILKALPIAKKGVAMLTRTVFIEGKKRFQNIFDKTPPTYMAQFVERVPMVKGRLDPNVSTATGYCWLIWLKESQTFSTHLIWIPPCRKLLEHGGDYEWRNL